MKTFFAVIGGIVAFGIWWACAALWSAFVFTKLWWWFVMPLLHLPALSVPVAYGLIVVIGFLRGHSSRRKGEKESWTAYYSGEVALTLLGPAISLGVGWVAHLFTATP